MDAIQGFPHTPERISLRQLDYFVTAADAGTITGAAQRLYVSQSAVSAGLSELEHQLRVQLLIRAKAKGLALTAAGRRLLPEARALLARCEELQLSMRELGQASTGKLVIGCFTTMAPFLLPRLLEGFQARHPEVTLDFVEGSLTELQQFLREGRCELAVLYGVDIESGIEFETLFATGPHVLLSPTHPLASRDRICLADLAEHHMIMLDVPPSQQYFSKVLTNAGIHPVIRHRTQSFEMVRSLVARGVGYSLLIQRPVLDLSYEGRQLQLRGITDEIEPLPVVLAHPTGAQLTRRAAAFATFCRSSMAALPQSEERDGSLR
ncbi:LysR family transcriptional regulator [Streptomyces sp. NPDC051561]|uniref:LysR family transcriptional regulator n=1 Tax=Streptomyces sp. NPDC051561 TaxID=3365658 RepID=UPI0037A5ACF6